MLAFERSISPERWQTYQRHAGFNNDLAHRLYLWNAAMGQSFHFPLQTAEVALRNVVHRALATLHGPAWAFDVACRESLGDRPTEDINKAERRHLSIYKAAPSTSQIVASLSLGFWVSLLRQKFAQAIWSTQAVHAFPNLATGETVIHVSRTATVVQDLRNRIFHQEPLVGHDLSGDYGAILKLVGWICLDTRDWMRAHSSVAKVMRERPR